MRKAQHNGNFSISNADASEIQEHLDHGPSNQNKAPVDPPIHRAALHGYSIQAAAYERGRPDYPLALVAWLMTQAGATPGSKVLDLGAGTGKFTALLLRCGAEVIAVEPVDAMRERLIKTVPDVLVVAGTAQQMPLQNGRVNLVVCAQAFHWFANLLALREIHRVLAPGGRLCLIWNVRDESVGWVKAISSIIAPYQGDTPQFHTNHWRAVLNDQNLFTKPRCTTFGHRQFGSFNEVIVDRVLSISFIAKLPESERNRVTARLQALRDGFPVLREETIDFPYRTQAWLCKRMD